jgi:hypothetical protein
MQHTRNTELTKRNLLSTNVRKLYKNTPKLNIFKQMMIFCEMCAWLCVGQQLQERRHMDASSFKAQMQKHPQYIRGTYNWNG